MSIPNALFEYDPSNEVQQSDIFTLGDTFQDAFADNGPGVQQLMSPQDAQPELQEIINELDLGIMQHMLNSDIPLQEQEQVWQSMKPQAPPDLSELERDSLFVGEQNIFSDRSFGDGLLIESNGEEEAWQAVSQLEFQLQDGTDRQRQVELPEALSEQIKPKIQQRRQMLQSEHLTNENEMLQLEESTEQEQQKKRSNPTLRLRMRLQPNACQQEQIEPRTSAQSQLEGLIMEPRQFEPLQIPAPSDPLTDFFGHSQIQIPSHVPRRCEPFVQDCVSSVQTEDEPNERNSITNLPFWKAENPSNVPSHHFLKGEQPQKSDLLQVMSTNLFANEITDGAAEVKHVTENGSRRAKGSRKSEIVYAIDVPSEFTQTKLLSKRVTEDLVHELLPALSSKGSKESKPKERNVKSKKELRPQRQEIRSTCSINSNSDEDEDYRSDPSYIPEETDQRSEEPSFNHFSSDLQITAERQHHENSTIAVTSLEQSMDSIREEMSIPEFQSSRVTCPKCNDTFANSDSFDRHFRFVHSKPKGKVHVCKECQQICRSEQNLRRHWSNVHTGELKFVCECGARFSTKRSLSLHRPKQHPDVCKPRPKRKKKKFHECQMCDYTSDQSYNVIRHFFTKHTDNVAMECIHGCGKTFKSVSNAKVHFPKCKRRP